MELLCRAHGRIVHSTMLMTVIGIVRCKCDTFDQDRWKESPRWNSQSPAFHPAAIDDRRSLASETIRRHNLVESKTIKELL